MGDLPPIYLVVIRSSFPAAIFIDKLLVKQDVSSFLPVAQISDGDRDRAQ